MVCIPLQTGQGHRVLCRLEDIPQNGSKGIAARPGTGYAELLLVRVRDRVYAYRNRCPHTGAPMEWQPDVFLDRSASHIQCGLHGALFRIHDGHCIFGPCAGRTLEAVRVEIQSGWVMLTDDCP